MLCLLPCPPWGALPRFANKTSHCLQGSELLIGPLLCWITPQFPAASSDPICQNLHFLSSHPAAPLDEALVHVVLDLSGRPHLSCGLDIPTERIGSYETQLVEHFFQSLVNTSGMTLHIRQVRCAGRAGRVGEVASCWATPAGYATYQTHKELTVRLSGWVRGPGRLGRNQLGEGGTRRGTCVQLAASEGRAFIRRVSVGRALNMSVWQAVRSKAPWASILALLGGCSFACAPCSSSSS